MDSEDLVTLILKTDPTAGSWIFNCYCPVCARFLYPEDLVSGSCKKCNASTRTAIKHPVPFLTSATALEKLLVWLTKMSKADEKYLVLLEQVERFFSDWIYGSLTSQQYRQKIVDQTVKFLNA